MRTINKVSKVLGLRSAEEVKGSLVSQSQKLFSELNLVRSENGFSTLLPIMVKSLRKLENLMRKEMKEISAHEILLPSVTGIQLLQKAGRDSLPDLFKLNKLHEKEFVLNPTCEEAITHLVSCNSIIYENHLPFRFYQISSKFRDEKRSKSGLLRSKEFLMKDLYTFDSNLVQCKDAYEEITQKYNDFFQKLKIPYVHVKGSEGDIKNLQSHEFHFISDAGENELILCQNCGHKEGQNQAEKIEKICSNCSNTNVKVCKSIEVAHTFQLGTFYTKPLNAFYKNKKGFKELIHMNSFGIGLTRLLAASVEVLCQNKQIRWPISIAPYLLCIIPPKMGSKEEIGCGNLVELVYDKLEELLLDDILVDDRVSLTIGNRLSLIKSLGIPFVVIIGKEILNDPPLIEFQDVNANSVNLIQVSEISQFVSKKLSDELDNVSFYKKESLAL